MSLTERGDQDTYCRARPSDSSVGQEGGAAERAGTQLAAWSCMAKISSAHRASNTLKCMNHARGAVALSDRLGWGRGDEKKI